MLEVLVRNRRWLLLRGYAVIVFAALAVMWPRLTLIVLVLLYGTYALVDGVAALLLARRGSRLARAETGSLVLVDVFGVIAGILYIALATRLGKLDKGFRHARAT